MRAHLLLLPLAIFAAPATVQAQARTVEVTLSNFDFNPSTIRLRAADGRSRRRFRRLVGIRLE